MVFTPYSEQQLQKLHDDIVGNAGPVTALRYINRIIDYCLGLGSFPRRGRERDDIRPGLGVLGSERRVTKAYAIDGDRILIRGVFHEGQDFEDTLRDSI